MSLVRIVAACLAALSFSLIVHAQGRDMTPRSVVSELIAAMDANDAARISAVFVEDASQAYGQGTPRRGEAFWTWLRSDIIRAQGRVIDPIITADGTTVVVTGQYRNNAGYSAPANFLLTVKDGKITSWTMRY